MFNRNGLFLIASLLVSLHALAGQTQIESKIPLSGNWIERMKAFYHFCQSGNRDQLLQAPTAQVTLTESEKQNISALFRLEAGEMRHAANLSEEHLSYFADLMSVAAKLRDPQNLPTFLEPFVLDSGEIAVTGSAQLGSSAIRPTLEKLDYVENASSNSDKLYTMSLILALDKMLESSTSIPPEDRVTIRDHLLKMSHGSNEYLRAASLRGLITINDSASRSRILELSVTDPWTTHLPAGKAFPIRDMAKAALKTRAAMPPQNAVR